MRSVFDAQLAEHRYRRAAAEFSELLLQEADKRDRLETGLQRGELPLPAHKHAEHTQLVPRRLTAIAVVVGTIGVVLLIGAAFCYFGVSSKGIGKPIMAWSLAVIAGLMALLYIGLMHRVAPENCGACLAHYLGFALGVLGPAVAFCACAGPIEGDARLKMLGSVAGALVIKGLSPWVQRLCCRLLGGRQRRVC
jgi:hypothetical protein